MKPNSEQLPIREASGGGEDGRGVATPPRCCPVDPRLTAVLLQSRLKAPLPFSFGAFQSSASFGTNVL